MSANDAVFVLRTMSKRRHKGQPYEYRVAGWSCEIDSLQRAFGDETPTEELTIALRWAWDLLLRNRSEYGIKILDYPKTPFKKLK